MMLFGALGAAVLIAIQSIALKKVHTNGLRQTLLTTGIMSAFIALGFGAYILIAQTAISGFTVFMGLLFSVSFVSTIVLYHFAMQTGPLSYTTFFFSASMIIPSILGIILWDEPFTWQVCVGLLLFLFAFYLISKPNVKENKKISGKWILLCFLSWLGNGCCSLIVKIHQMQMLGQESNEMLTVAYPCAAILCFCVYLILRFAKKSNDSDKPLIRLSTLWLVLAAAGNGLGNMLVAMLAAKVSAAYLYPIVLGGMLIIVTLYSVSVLKEKISKAGTCGILIGIAAIVLMNLSL